jgi:GH18 family chitinase
MTPTTAPNVTLPTKRIVGYYAGWAAARGRLVSSIPAEKLTHINYAFSNVSENGECVLGDPVADVKRSFSADESVSGVDDSAEAGALRGNFNQLKQLKQKFPHLQVLIAVGGWTWSGNFSDAALTEASRQAFAKSCIDLYLKQYAGVFDGIDIDWEFPVSGGLNPGRPEDKRNFTLFLAELRRQLDELGDADGRRYLLTIAAPAGPGIYQNIERGEIIQYLDWINLMTYDLHGTWEAATNFNAPLFKAADDPESSLNVDAAVQSYLNAGVPADKLVMGVPFYGRGWKGVPKANNGLYQKTNQGAAPGSWGEPGAFEYKDLKQNYLPTYSRFWSDEALVPWLYNPDTGIFITYDDPESLSAKTGYVSAHDLGGVMIWELSQDDGSLLDAIHTGLQSESQVALILTAAPRPAIGRVSGSPRPFEKEIHSVSGITIDGKLDDWPAEPTFTFDDEAQIVYRSVTGNWGGPKDFSAQAWAGWADDGLYFAFKVTDDKHVQIWSGPALWMGDYMEMQIDTQLEKDYDETGMTDDDYQIGISPGDFTKVLPEAQVWFGPASEAQVKEIQQAQIKTSDGYILEVFIPKSLLKGITLSEGATFGMNINPSDTDNSQQPQKLMMSTSTTRTLTDPTTWGKIILVR